MTDAELAELLRSVISRPDDLDVLRVYADVLIERGDVRGEMIAVQLLRREQDSDALEARERELAVALDAALVAQLDQPGTVFAWRRGFLEAVDFTPVRERRALPDALRRLGTLPVARQLRRIVIRIVEPGWGSMGPIISALAKVAPQLRMLRELVFTQRPRERDGVPVFPSNFGDLAPLCRAIPKLEVLEIGAYDYATLRDVQVPALKRLVLERPLYDVDRLGAMNVPNLEELEIYSDRWEGSHLDGFLVRELPLRHLVLSSPNRHALEYAARYVPSSAVFKNVRVFELLGAPLDGPCVDALLLHTSRLLKLKQFGIERATPQYRRLANVLGPILMGR